MNFGSSFGASIGGNFSEHLQTDRINSSSIYEFCDRILEVIKKARVREGMLDVDAMEKDPVVRFRLYKMVYDRMPLSFQKSVPCCWPKAGSGNKITMLLSEVRTFLNHYLIDHETLEKSGYDEDMVKFTRKMNLKKFKEFVKKEVVEKDELYPQIKDNDSLLGDYMTMLEVFIDFYCPEERYPHFDLTEILSSDALEIIKGGQNTKEDSFAWCSLDLCIHLHAYFRFLAKKEPQISKERFGIFRHYKDYQYSSDYFSNDFQHAPGFSEYFLERLFEVLAEKRLLVNGGIAFELFLKLQLMLDEKKSKQTLTFMFEVCDINKRGRIGRMEIQRFYEEFTLVEGADDILSSLPDFINCALHMIPNSKEEDSVTLDDILQASRFSGEKNYADTFLFALASFDVWIKHENRNEQPGNPSDDTQAEPEPEPTPEEQHEVNPDDLDYLLGEKKLNLSI